jgi:hypothetical protein
MRLQTFNVEGFRFFDEISLAEFITKNKVLSPY